jgi:hypothetical protein
MAQHSGLYDKVRKLFGVLFILSTCLLLVSILFLRGAGGRPPGSMGPSDSIAPENNLFGFLSLLTSVASLIGFASTTYLQLREEQREAKTTELELKRKELEIEKLKIELEKLKSGTHDKQRDA